jgi:O-antigen/teichoic acid export membrane protein
LNKKSTFSNILSVFSTNIFVVALTVTSGIILPRLLNPNSLGKLNSLLALAFIVYSFTFLGMRTSLLMHLGKFKLDKEKVLSALAYIYIFSVLLSTSALLIFFFLISDDHFPVDIIILIILINPLEFLISYLQGYSLAHGKIGRFNRLMWIPKLIYLLSLLLFLALFKLQVKGAILAGLAANLVTLLIYLNFSSLTLPKFRRDKFPWKTIKSLVGYGILFAISLLLIRLNHKIDILILKRMCDLAEVGYYSLGVNVAEMIWQVPMAVGLVLMTKSATTDNQDLVTRQVCSTLRISMLIVLAATLVLFLAAPLLVRLAFGDAYLPSIPIIRAILPGIMFFVILKILNSQFIGTGKPQLTFIALLPSLALNIVLNLLLIPHYKGVGSAIATNFSYCMASVMLIWVYSRTFKISFSQIFRFRRSDFFFLKKIIRKQII